MTWEICTKEDWYVTPHPCMLSVHLLSRKKSFQHQEGYQLYNYNYLMQFFSGWILYIPSSRCSTYCNKYWSWPI